MCLVIRQSPSPIVSTLNTHWNVSWMFFEQYTSKFEYDKMKANVEIKKKKKNYHIPDFLFEIPNENKRRHDDDA